MDEHTDRPADETAAPHPQSDVALLTDTTFAIERGADGDGLPRLIQRRPPTTTDALGVLAPGALAVVVDSALGRCVMPALDPDERIVTSHMHLEFLQRFTDDLDAVHTESFPVRVGGGSAFARVEMRSADDALIATATGRFAVLPISNSAGGVIGGSAPVPGHVPARGTPHPLVAGHGIHDLLDTRVLDTDAGVRVACVAGPQLANERFGLHGGVGVLIGERTNELALRHARPDAAMRPVELRVAFVRPIPAVGQLVECRAVVVNAGRTVAVTRAELFTPDGRLALVVDGIHVDD